MTDELLRAEVESKFRPACSIRLGGTAIAIGMATAHSIWVGLLVLLRGSPHFAEYDVYAGRVIGAYYQAALLAGPLCGLLWTHPF